MDDRTLRAATVLFNNKPVPHIERIVFPRDMQVIPVHSIDGFRVSQEISFGSERDRYRIVEVSKKDSTISISPIVKQIKQLG